MGGTLDRIKQSGKLTLGYSPDARPFSFKDPSGPSGYAIDLCLKIADAVKAEFGLSALSVTFVSLERNQAARAIAQGKVDLLCAPVPQTAATRQEASFSTPIFASGVAVLVRSDASERLKQALAPREPANSPTWRANAERLLPRTTLAAVGDSRAQHVVEEKLKELQLKGKVMRAMDYSSGVMQVAEYRIDALFGDRAILLDAVKRYRKPSELEVLDRVYTHEAGALALARGDEDFKIFVDKALARIFRSVEFNDLYAKWFGPPSESALNFIKSNALPE